GGLVFWVRRSSTTDPPSSSFGRTFGATGAGAGGFVAIQFILASATLGCSQQVNWWRHRYIQAPGSRLARLRTNSGRPPSEAALPLRLERRITLVCEIVDSRACNRDTSHDIEGLQEEEENGHRYSEMVQRREGFRLHRARRRRSR